MIVDSPLELCAEPLFLRLQLEAAGPVLLKIEGLNAAGSIKFKAAVGMIQDLEASGQLRPGGRVIESSSGNLGLALAIVCASKGYGFCCVSDPNISPQTAKLIRGYGAELIVVTERDVSGGYLHTRIATIHQMLANDPLLVWTNQYANPANSAAHYQLTGPEILRAVPSPAAVFIGAGTTGTLMGCARFLRVASPHTRLYAVDAVGSILFADTPGRRHLPGLGASRIPELLDRSLVDEHVLVEERETVAMCRHIARNCGLMVGASTGTVLAAVQRKFGSDTPPPSGPVVAISPDMGDRYVDTVYDDEWVSCRYGALPIPFHELAV